LEEQEVDDGTQPTLPNIEAADSANGDGGNDDEGGETTVREDGPSALREMMAGYFMEYASYVIRDRAIPHLDDGFKPVQCRILHSLHELDDGKFHKVANIVGNTMKYHPHGDMSIYNALVHIANKGYFIDRQGNFGNIYTGDGASAARYIECRLSPLAREVLFNKEITHFVPSYDGRNQEPVTLPAKVPVLLMQGSEGIAVGMATYILPHNFSELLNAQIAILNKKPFEIYPDFIQGCTIDVAAYEDGLGKIRVRAVANIVDPKTIVIREIPPTTTTESLMNSIEDAVNKGKLKVSAVTDFTAEKVEIEIKLPRGVQADAVLPALYAYTNCEISISCNCLVIYKNRPIQMTVSDVLRHNTNKLVDDLKWELEILLAKLEDQHHMKTLAQIFIENRIYKRIEECKTMALVMAAVYDGLAPFRDQLTREVTDDDIGELLKIPIRRISLFDINKNRQELADIMARIEEARDNLANIKRYTIAYIKGLIKKYGKDYPRRSRLGELHQVDVREIALKNHKVGVDRKEGYLGTTVKDADPIACTEYDKLVVLKWDGTYKVIHIPEKQYIGPVCMVMKVNKDQVYSMIYRDRKTRICYAKRFQIKSFIMDREYTTVPKGCKVEKIFDRFGVVLRCEIDGRAKDVDVDFDEIPTRGTSARGTRLSTKPVTKILQLKRGTDSKD
jgi:topoisomerase-4 subunit A